LIGNVLVLRYKKHSCWLCFLLLSFSYNHSLASFQSALVLESQLSLFDYQETDRQGESLNTEVGQLLGGRLALQFEFNDFLTELSAQQLSGQVRYRGKTQTGSQHSTNTYNKIFRSELVFGYRFHLPFKIEPRIGLQYYSWYRGIRAKNSVSSLTEDYRGKVLKPSVRFYLAQGYLAQNYIELGLTRTFNNSMKIQATQCLSSVTVYPKADTAWFVRGHKQLFENRNYSSFISLSIDQYRMQESDVESGQTCFGPVGWSEPDNWMRLIQFGLGFRF